MNFIRSKNKLTDKYFDDFQLLKSDLEIYIMHYLKLFF